MADDNPTTNSIVSLIPEFHFDLIGRIVPGIIFCWHFVNLPSFTGELAPVLIWFICSYFAGFTLDILGLISTRLLLRFVFETDWFIPNWLGIVLHSDKDFIWKGIDASELSRRAVFVKWMAEVLMFDSVLLIGILMFFLPTVREIPFSISWLYWACGLIFTGLVGHIQLHKASTKRMSKYKEFKACNDLDTHTEQCRKLNSDTSKKEQTKPSVSQSTEPSASTNPIADTKDVAPYARASTSTTSAPMTKATGNRNQKRRRKRNKVS